MTNSSTQFQLFALVLVLTASFALLHAMPSPQHKEDSTAILSSSSNKADKLESSLKKLLQLLEQEDAEVAEDQADSSDFATADDTDATADSGLVRQARERKVNRHNTLDC